MPRRCVRPESEQRFVSAMFHRAFGLDSTPTNELTPKKQSYLEVLRTVARKLGRFELDILANIADGLDFDGNPLRERRER